MAEYFFNGQRSRLSVRTAYRDIFSAIVLFPLCWYLGWGDVRQRYVRTFLGPLWIIIGTGLWVAVMGFVMSALFGNSLRQTLPFIASGVIVWNRLAVCIIKVYVSWFDYGKILRYFNRCFTILNRFYSFFLKVG